MLSLGVPNSDRSLQQIGFSAFTKISSIFVLRAEKTIAFKSRSVAVLHSYLVQICTASQKLVSICQIRSLKPDPAYPSQIKLILPQKKN